jgi:hypothetical protein
LPHPPACRWTTDRSILTTLVLKPLRQLELARRIGVCSLTAKRRLALLIERGLARQDGGKFMVTDTGCAALGPDAKRHRLRKRHEIADLSASGEFDIAVWRKERGFSALRSLNQILAHGFGRAPPLNLCAEN